MPISKGRWMLAIPICLAVLALASILIALSGTRNKKQAHGTLDVAGCQEVAWQSCEEGELADVFVYVPVRDQTLIDQVASSYARRCPPETFMQVFLFDDLNAAKKPELQTRWTPNIPDLDQLMERHFVGSIYIWKGEVISGSDMLFLEPFGPARATTQTAPMPATATGQVPSEEERAAAKLRLARLYISSPWTPRGADLLREVMRVFPGTTAAKDAKIELQKHTVGNSD